VLKQLVVLTLDPSGGDDSPLIAQRAYCFVDKFPLELSTATAQFLNGTP